jgi:hypothetical protein
VAVLVHTLDSVEGLLGHAAYAQGEAGGDRDLQQIWVAVWKAVSELLSETKACVMNSL